MRLEHSDNSIKRSLFEDLRGTRTPQRSVQSAAFLGKWGAQIIYAGMLRFTGRKNGCPDMKREDLLEEPYGARSLAVSTSFDGGDFGARESAI